MLRCTQKVRRAMRGKIVEFCVVHHAHACVELDKILFDGLENYLNDV